MKNLTLQKLAAQLWQDERGFIQSAELVLIGTLAVIGLIVGLAAFRDGTLQELADTGVAVGQLDQSYAVEISGTDSDLIEFTEGDDDDEVVITGTFGSVIVTSSFKNYSYSDQPDVGDDVSLQGPNEPPAGIEYSPLTSSGEGEAP